MKAPKIHCWNCKKQLTNSITHETDKRQFNCPECGQVFFEYPDSTGLDETTFKHRFGQAQKEQFANVQRLFPHTPSKVFGYAKPQERAVSTFATSLLFDTIYKSLVKELYPADAPKSENVAE